MNQRFIEKHLKHLSWLSILLYPFSLIYALAVTIWRFSYVLSPDKAFKSRIKVISVGNITVGGSGKTPFVLFLAKKLQEEKKKIAIVTRGYKSGYEGKNKLILQSTFYLHESNAIGDEAALLLNNLPNTPVVIGKNRIKSIQLLEAEFPDLDYIIMDDGFQHLKVVQDIKICIFNTISPVGNGLCLPAGILREPFGCLKYADYLVMNGDKSKLSGRFNKKIANLKKPILNAEYYISEIRDVNKKLISTSQLRNRRILLISGIGSPKSFENSINTAGLTFDDHIALNDHFNYTEDYFTLHRKQFLKYDYIITTEKDYTKLQTIKTDLPLLVAYVMMMMYQEFEL